MTAPLVSCIDITKSFGTKTLFENLNFMVAQKTRLALIGPNGSGKSTLLKMIADEESTEEGRIVRKQGIAIGYVPQISEHPALPLREIMLKRGGDPVKIETLLSRFSFPDLSADKLSGGWQKKFDIALALLNDPDLLILDEPTNHLDLETISWLENMLIKSNKTLLFTSHDRSFLDKLALEVVEINPIYPEGCFKSEGNYSSFIAKKEAYLEHLQDYRTGLASKVRKEEAWLRTTPQARTTKSRSRIDSAERLIQELSILKNRLKEKKMKIGFSTTERETRKLLQGKNLSKTLSGKLLFNKLDINLSPGLKIGLVGPNGSGKTTLMKVLEGSLEPDTGTIKAIEGLKTVYFDQARRSLPLNLTIKEALSPYSDTVIYQGKPMHVHSWGKKFFFSPDQMSLPLSFLSGGERARITIARLMLEEADILFLDEPTNDLDIETLEVLEESLSTFPGAVVIISHDRTLIDHVADRLIAIDLPDDPFCEDLEQYERKKKAISPPPTLLAKETTPHKTAAPLKLSYKEKYEHEILSKELPLLEQVIADLHTKLSNTQELKELQALSQELEKKEKEYEVKFFRWHEIQEKYEV